MAEDCQRAQIQSYVPKNTKEVKCRQVVLGERKAYSLSAFVCVNNNYNKGCFCSEDDKHVLDQPFTGMGLS